MPPIRLFIRTLLTMIAFAGNSLLCRRALDGTGTDPASFTALRIAAGALVLYLLVRRPATGGTTSGNWLSALALFAYATLFSFALQQVPASAGTLLLFGAVQATMIGTALLAGERLSPRQWRGFLLALGGLVGMLLPGLSAPPLAGAVMMLGAGIAWGVYSIRGRRAGQPLPATAGNFLRAVPMAGLLALAGLPWLRIDAAGATLAIVSGAVTSGLGYALWYSILPALGATRAATVQLSVPVIAALAGAAWLGEPIGLRLLLAALAILGGIALVIARPRSRR